MRGGLLTRLTVAAAAGGCALAGPAHAGPPAYPKADGFVVDAAGQISAGDEAALERQLTAYERRTGHEVAVLVVRTLDGRPVEAYATGVFNAWGIGKRDKDNGVLLLVVMTERKLRIEVGRGVDDVLDNEEASMILDDSVRPLMRKGDVTGAVRAGTIAIRRELDAGPEIDPGAADDEVAPPRPYDDAPVGGFEPVGGLDADDDGFGGAFALVLLLGVLGIVGTLVVKALGGGSSWGSSGRRAGLGSAGRWWGGGSDRSGSDRIGSDRIGSDRSWSDSSGSSSGSDFGGGGSSSGSDFGGGSSDGGGASGDW